MYQDNKVEIYLSNIKNNTISEKIINYKKATKRLSILKSEYDELCKIFKKKSKKNNKKCDIDSLVDKLTKINDQLSDDKIDMIDLIKKFNIQKNLLDNFKENLDDIKNELFQIKESDGKKEWVKISL